MIEAILEGPLVEPQSTGHRRQNRTGQSDDAAPASSRTRPPCAEMDRRGEVTKTERRLERLVGQRDRVVPLEPRPALIKDLPRILDGWFRQVHPAEAPGESFVFLREFLFGRQPVIEILAIPPPARLVEVVREPSDLIP